MAFTLTEHWEYVTKNAMKFVMICDTWVNYGICTAIKNTDLLRGEKLQWGKNGLKIKEPFKFITGTTRLDEILNIPVNASKKI